MNGERRSGNRFASANGVNESPPWVLWGDVSLYGVLRSSSSIVLFIIQRRITKRSPEYAWLSVQRFEDFF